METRTKTVETPAQLLQDIVIAQFIRFEIGKRMKAGCRDHATIAQYAARLGILEARTQNGAVDLLNDHFGTVEAAEHYFTQRGKIIFEADHASEIDFEYGA